MEKSFLSEVTLYIILGYLKWTPCPFFSFFWNKDSIAIFYDIFCFLCKSYIQSMHAMPHLIPNFGHYIIDLIGHWALGQNHSPWAVRHPACSLYTGSFLCIQSHSKPICGTHGGINNDVKGAWTKSSSRHLKASLKI